ncbi:MAG: hypothetical protein KGI02_05420 [Thaumarchaeota archaeon]|nr:hypothetical protein [Nitrososphaerota archaeon]MDE1840902.1 hypothetical protein [Nitrososphaerota archaeon]MDE1877450.1 hypothetical protein [Nitrososphaerota archaeon]
MIGLAKGQQIRDKIKAQSKMGRGTLYLLNTGIVFEIHGRGLFLELENDEICHSSATKKDSLVISWTEGISTYDIKFNIKNAAEVVQKINQYS